MAQVLDPSGVLDGFHVRRLGYTKFAQNRLRDVGVRRGQFGDPFSGFHRERLERPP